MRFGKVVVLEPKPYLVLREKEFGVLAGFVQFYSTDPVSPAEIISRLEGCDAVILGHTPLRDASIFEALPKLRYVGLDSTDYSFVDADLLKRFGVALTNVPGYATDAVARFVFSRLSDYYKSSSLTPQRVFGSDDACLKESFKGKVMGVIGLGRIGSKVASVALSYGMKVLYFSRHKKVEGQGFEFVGLGDLLQCSDVIVVACSLNKDSYFMLNKEMLGMVKKGCVFVNVARAGVVDYDALAECLNTGRIAAAVLDVLPNEPPRGDELILSAKNVILTYHTAWKSPESIRTLYSTVISNMQSYLRGEWVNRIV